MYYCKTSLIMCTFFAKITLWKQVVHTIHRSIILPFRNHTSFITGESITESKQQQWTMDALQFNIKQVIKVKQSKCYTIRHWVRRLETPKLKCQNRFQEAQPAHQYLTASFCSHHRAQSILSLHDVCNTFTIQYLALTKPYLTTWDAYCQL